MSPASSQESLTVKRDGEKQHEKAPVLLLALNLEKGVRRQGVRAASRSWDRQENSLPRSLQKEGGPAHFSPVKAILESDIQNCTIMKWYCLGHEVLSFVTAVMENESTGK